MSLHMPPFLQRYIVSTGWAPLHKVDPRPYTLAKNKDRQVLHVGCLHHLIPTPERRATITPRHSRRAKHPKIATLPFLSRVQTTTSFPLDRDVLNDIPCRHGVTKGAAAFILGVCPASSCAALWERLKACLTYAIGWCKALQGVLIVARTTH